MAGIDVTPILDVAQPPVTAHEFVHDTLRRAILSGALPGGARLVQADIASQLSVSTTPVREALRDLAAEGLVVFRAHIGAVVRELDVAELIELYDIRKALEPLAIRRAAALISPEELARAQALAKAMEQETDPAAWTELNRKFHGVLEGASRASFIQSVLKGVQDIAAIYVAHALVQQPSRIASGNKEHRALLTALRRHDGDAAAALLVTHLEATLQEVLKHQTDDAQRAPASRDRQRAAGPAGSAGSARSRKGREPVAG
jgi:DNA-binding GntR family transcriptional regulator